MAPSSVPRKGTSSLLMLGVVGALGILAIALFTHATHVAAYLAFLILLACPLMHIFMHRGHGDSGHNTRE